MTDLVLLVVAVLMWTIPIGFTVDALLHRRRTRDLNRHIDEAIATTRPLGPEDEPDWGKR